MRLTLCNLDDCAVTASKGVCSDSMGSMAGRNLVQRRLDRKSDDEGREILRR